MSAPVRVLVVDDSALMRKLIPQLLERDSNVRVVATAVDGNFGLKKIAELRPDVVTLDLEMPGMGGMETLKEIRKHFHVPVIVVSSHTTSGATTTLKALGLGAFDFVAKPKCHSDACMSAIGTDLIAKVKAAAQSGTTLLPFYSTATRSVMAKSQRKIKPKAESVVAIGISTGGPNALEYLLSELPADFPAALLIVQHMPEGFTSALASRLNEVSAIEVKEAASGDMLLAGRALVCPGNRHVRVRRMALGAVTVLTDEDRVKGHRPSADILFRSCAEEFGNRCVGLIMTGMGEDGAHGIGHIKAVGGLTIAQHEASCVVYGMPRVAVDLGHIDRIVPLESIGLTLQNHYRGQVARKGQESLGAASV
jgi:two-component system, chemotaxis family, protein-glutamate methylesterase/glutaminase